jgi:hypothetical protein
MTYKRIVVLPVLAGVVGALMFAGPASADTTGSTPVTFEVGGGALSMTVPTGTVDLGSVPVSANAQAVSAQLGTVTVTDDRGATEGWTVTASATDFVGPQSISVSAAGSSSYGSPPAEVFGTADVAPTNLTALYPPAAVQVATGVDGVNAATWNPTISVTIPADALAGTYSSAVTHSVS